jgi:TonB family protein
MEREVKMRLSQVAQISALIILTLVFSTAAAFETCVYDVAGAAQERNPLTFPPGVLPPEPPPTLGAALDAPYNRHFAPCFPASAARRGHFGTVVLQLYIDANGTIRDVKIAQSSGYAELDESAIDAAKHWKALFPATRNRVPYGSWLQVPVNFGPSY